MILEWAPKGSLEDLLAEPTLTFEEPLLQLAADIARGLIYLHERSFFDEMKQCYRQCIVHRDMKPENVLISEYTRGKVSDFGSSVCESDVNFTLTGTPLYCAPEIMNGQECDERVDV